MWNNHNAQRAAMLREYQSDMWIQRNIPGGLNSPLGQRLDNYFGGNPNPTAGQIYNATHLYPSYGNGYGYQYRRW